MKSVRETIGPVFATGANKTEAKASVADVAGRLLTQIDRARPMLAMWRDQVSLIYPVFSAEGEMMWQYTNPREVRIVAQDAGREAMGTGGYWPNGSLAYSAAIAHMIQIDSCGIPDDDSLPDCLHPKDRENLADLRRLHAIAA